MQQGSGLKPAWSQGGGVAERRHGIVGTQNHLESVVQNETIPAGSALAAAHKGSRLEEHKFFPGEVQLARTRQTRQSASNYGNHAASLFKRPQKQTRFARRRRPN
jgi:hypothetical protein